ncbi:hypothetical protein [Amycolatopsis sp. cmx-4-68]|uniref:hypothetical protein n=1 Tax=Amycolatopsis sp. cmx-4-68 TaxID=2790938 RepID=UPI00397A7387
MAQAFRGDQPELPGRLPVRAAAADRHRDEPAVRVPLGERVRHRVEDLPRVRRLAVAGEQLGQDVEAGFARQLGDPPRQREDVVPAVAVVGRVDREEQQAGGVAGVGPAGHRRQVVLRGGQVSAVQLDQPAQPAGERAGHGLGHRRRHDLQELTGAHGIAGLPRGVGGLAELVRPRGFVHGANLGARR